MAVLRDRARRCRYGAVRLVRRAAATRRAAGPTAGRRAGRGSHRGRGAASRRCRPRPRRLAFGGTPHVGTVDDRVRHVARRRIGARDGRSGDPGPGTELRPAIAGRCPAGRRELRPDRACCFGVAALAHRACVGPARPLRRLLARRLRPAAVEPRRRARPIDPRAAPLFRSSHGGGRRTDPDRRHARLDSARRQPVRCNLHGLWLAVAAQARPCRPAARPSPGQPTGARRLPSRPARVVVSSGSGAR